MKKLVITLFALVAFSTFGFSQRPDWPKIVMVLDNDAVYNAPSAKLSNGSMTVYVDGNYRKLKKEGKIVDGTIVIGKDKKGDMWVANLSDYRMDVKWEWQPNTGWKVQKKELMDPWEICRLTDKNGKLVDGKNVKSFRVLNAYEH